MTLMQLLKNELGGLPEDPPQTPCPLLIMDRIDTQKREIGYLGGPLDPVKTQHFRHASPYFFT